MERSRSSLSQAAKNFLSSYGSFSVEESTGPSVRRVRRLRSFLVKRLKRTLNLSPKVNKLEVRRAIVLSERPCSLYHLRYVKTSSRVCCDRNVLPTFA